MPRPVGRKELDIFKELKEKLVQWKVLSKAAQARWGESSSS